jgi:LmbE family N-acetylglucosaminyl deacetylase
LRVGAGWPAPARPWRTLDARLPNVLVVSTHLDDAVFSCWSVITDRRHDVSVLTVFTAALPGVQSSWDAILDPSIDSELRAEERRAEDRAALAIAGRNPIHLPFHDEQFGRTERPLIVEALRPHVAAADTVYAPLAIRHEDHLLVRQAIGELRRRPYYYVDYPYRLAFPIQPREAGVGLLDAYDSVDVVLTRDEVARKLAACRQYSGELDRLRTGKQFGHFLAAEKLRHETFFVPRPLE